jgi:hypothetical protein
MLVTPFPGFEAENCAAKVRAIAERVHCPPSLVEQVVAETVNVYEHTHNRADAINAGLAFIERMKSGQPARLAERQPCEVRARQWNVAFYAITFAAVVLAIWVIVR